MVLGGRRNILINKDCYSANETTNQAVGSSNLSGRAIFQRRTHRHWRPLCHRCRVVPFKSHWDRFSVEVLPSRVAAKDKRLGRYSTFAVLISAVLLYMLGCSGPTLEPWHTVMLDAEFTGEKADEINSFKAYL